MTLVLDAAGQEAANRFVHDLVVGLVNLDLHAPDSAHVEQNLRQTMRDFRDVARATAPHPVRLDVTGGQLRLCGQMVQRASLQAGRLLRLCQERSITAMVFHRHLDTAEALRFLQLLSDPGQIEAFSPQSIGQALERHGISRIQVSLGADSGVDAAASLIEGDRPDASVRHYRAMADLLQDSHVAAFRGETLAVDAAWGVVERTISELDQEPSGLLTLALQDDIDQFTVGHSVRVTLLALHVAQELGASRRDLMRVGTAALLHDIGKSRIPQEILFKAGRLDAEERTIMAQHARWGGEILIEHRDVDPAAIGAAHCHHMGPCGGGYPARPTTLEPSGVSRLVRVCDVFEALTSARPYKPPMPPLHAYVIMLRMKDAFDPQWLQFFIRCIGLHPIGTHLLLDTGEEARVIDHGPTLHRPRVEVLRGPDGAATACDAPRQLTIGEASGSTAREIRAVLSRETRIELPSESTWRDRGDIDPQDPGC